MDNKHETLFEQLKQAVLDNEPEKFEALLKERKTYIESIESPTEKKEVLTYFIEKDKELAIILKAKKDGIQQLLVTQSNQLNAAKKYNQF